MAQNNDHRTVKHHGTEFSLRGKAVKSMVLSEASTDEYTVLYCEIINEHWNRNSYYNYIKTLENQIHKNFLSSALDRVTYKDEYVDDICVGFRISIKWRN